MNPWAGGTRLHGCRQGLHIQPLMLAARKEGRVGAGVSALSLCDLIDEALQANANEMRALADRISQEFGEVTFAGQFWHDTQVAFSHEYEGKINETVATRPTEGGGRGAVQAWTGQPIRQGLESANRQSRETSGGQPDAVDLGRDALGAVDVKQSTRRDLAQGDGQAAASTGARAVRLGDDGTPAQATQLAFEVAPDPANAELTAQWGQLSLKKRTAIIKDVKDAVLDDIIDAVGAKISKTVNALGGFDGLLSPNLITEYKVTQVPVVQARALAAVSLALDQDSVALVDPRVDSTAGLVRINLLVKADKHADTIFQAIRAAVPEISGFTARGNNFDVLNFTEMTPEALIANITEVLDGLDLDAEAIVTAGESQSERVKKADYESQKHGLRPGSGSEVCGRIERVRDRVRKIVADGIRRGAGRSGNGVPGTGRAGLDRGARPGAGRPAVARRDQPGPVASADGASIQRSPVRDESTAAGTDARELSQPGGV